MKFEKYTPNWRNVIFHEVRKVKTDGGIYIPEADFSITTHSRMFEHSVEHKADKQIGDYVVVKVGKDCTEIKPGDKIILEPGFMGQSLQFEDGIYFQIKEQQIAGYQRD